MTAPNTPAFIDYSQVSAWLKCPWYWYEKYVAGVVRAYGTAQRTDALCFGSLVHAGLESWNLHRRPEIEAGVIDEMNPTPDTLAEARRLLLGYVQNYPYDGWEIQRVEAPLTMPLHRVWDPDRHYNFDKYLLAKVDAYFLVREHLEVDSGLPGQTMTLTPGYWGFEHKTKSAGVDRAKWMQKWAVNLQASFQCLALSAHLHEPVQGVLVNVLERSRTYVPRRKCKGCEDTYELAAFLPTGTGAYACPMCGHKQVLKPYEPKGSYDPTYFRLAVGRCPGDLELAQQWATLLSYAMEDMRKHGKDSVVPNKEACVDTRWGGCDFFNPHTYGGEPVPDGINFQKARDYVGLVQIEEGI